MQELNKLSDKELEELIIKGEVTARAFSRRVNSSVSGS